MKNFHDLADILKRACAIEFPNQPHVDEVLASDYSEAIDTTNENPENAYLCLARHSDLLQRISTHQGFLHPLFITLLAYQMGGPINAATTAYGHDWRKSEGSTDLQAVHMEGDSGDILDDYRVTFAWERRGDTMKKLSGDHHIFLTGDTTPRQLAVVRSTAEENDNSAVTIIYDTKNVALSYECEDTSATRSSISLDFHVSRLTNDDLIIFGLPPPTEPEIEDLTLPQLLTKFPIHDYASHFHRLLFSPSSIRCIFTALDKLTVPAPTAALQPAIPSLKHRYIRWHADNLCHTPRSLITMSRKPLLDIYPTLTAFQHRLAFEMQLDMHRPLGVNFLPSMPIAAHREAARKWIRDLPGHVVFARLKPYVAGLSRNFPVTREGLLETGTLRWCAGIVERGCLEVVARGEVGIGEGTLAYAIGALARAIGDAVDGLKEADVVPEPWVDEYDLGIFRARCAYLFWCADWVAGLLEQGVGANEDGDMDMEKEKEKREMRGVSVSLLGNWMAWACVVEGLPGRPFIVQKTAV
ncbi:hypothetical protein K505DRAFT_255757 [Melanomma pulvis-pyrius CBS 109.77]|uniref:Uncharacterized protein n=1 Tax=Melanomma pulvis-pyrius CBS 109.77 TaxID=1314802 RepID=A0A6A6WX97_9PLEO|nr:hypothetical protein K505DRAFT_255757 [Melanomma pulvis-pyrius CBS 109.77]